jgi:hypothetical protein
MMRSSKPHELLLPPWQQQQALKVVEARRFTAMFGIMPVVCVDIWCRLGNDTETLDKNGANPVHLLWALMLLKLYATEVVLAVTIAGCDEKTFRKWSWHFVRGLADLEGSVVCCR